MQEKQGTDLRLFFLSYFYMKFLMSEIELQVCNFVNLQVCKAYTEN